jgi:hypothetical protein
MMNDKPVNDRNSSAFLFGLLGAGSAPEGKRLETGIGFTLASTFLEELQMEIERQRQEVFIRESVSGLFTSKSTAPKQIKGNAEVVVEAGALSVHKAKAIAEVDSRWREVIIHPSVVLLLVKRGSGKSALGYRLLELLYGLTPYVGRVANGGPKTIT